MLQLKLQSAKEGKYCFSYGPVNFKEIKFITPKRRSLILSLVSIKLGSCTIRFVPHASSKNPLVSHSYPGHK